MSQLTEEFNQALQFYFSEPSSAARKSRLVSVAYEVFNQSSIKKNKLEADRYMPEIEGFLLGCSLPSIKVSQETSKEMDKFIRSCTFSDDIRLRQSTHVLRMAHQFYFNSSFISSHEQAIRFQLWSFHQEITKLHDASSHKVMTNVHGLLQELVNDHFSLSEEEQKKDYVNFAIISKDILFNSQGIINRYMMLKTVAYNFLAAVAGLGLFYGLYLCVTRHQRNSFFLQPKDKLIADKATDEVLFNLKEDYMEQASPLDGQNHTDLVG